MPETLQTSYTAPEIHQSSAVPPAAPAMAKGSAAAGVQIINGTHASLDYQLDVKKLGASDKVEMWLTCDEGQSWQKQCEDADRVSPIECDLPGEGVYGLSVVVSSGSTSFPPAKGESPAAVVEVDLTKPVAQLQAIRPMGGEG